MTNFLEPFPSLVKGTIGFDDLLERIQKTNAIFAKNSIPTYPPYNIKKVEENKYVIELAVAGFSKQDIELELREGTLVISGKIHSEEPENFIFKGISDRAFTHRFTLADTIEVKNADLINGMLKIWLEKFIPEEKKPKKIDINEPTDLPAVTSKKKDKETA